MATRTASPPEILAGIDRAISATEAQYKAVLATAAERLQRAQEAVEQRRVAQAGGGVLVDEAPPELAEIAPESAVALHRLETRLDQLKELRGWVKIDPELAGFFTAPSGATPPDGGAAAEAAAPASLTASRPAAPARPRPLLPALVAVLALLIGWLASALVPAPALLHLVGR